jgi:hypothetical protein
MSERGILRNNFYAIPRFLFLLPFTCLLFINNAAACGGVFDVACNVTHGGLSPSNLLNQGIKSGQDLNNAANAARNAIDVYTPYLNPTNPLPLEVAQRCINDLAKCPQQLVARASYEIARPIVDTYIISLRNQVRSGGYHHLPDDFISDVSTYYSVNLNEVRYAENINTVHGQNMTLGNDIFLTQAMDWSSMRDRQLIYHELEHVVQYHNKGGIEPFLAEYIAHSFGQIIASRSVNIHDSIDIERAAINKADYVVKNVGYRISVRNDCVDQIKVAVSFLDSANKWQTMGY